MALKFAANLSYMFVPETESLVDRYRLAADAGFHAVECGQPYEYPLDELVAVKESANLQQVLINTWSGGSENGGYGVAALPGKEELFREKLEDTIRYAKALKCPRVRIMAAKSPEGVSQSDMEAVYIENLKYAAGRLEQEGIVGMIEPCNSKSMPGYLVNTFDKALQYIKVVNSPNIRLQLDFFHLQQIEGNLTSSIERYLPFVEHVQVAQVPHRHEVSSDGEINYRYIFSLLQEKGYQGWIGLEHKPLSSTSTGLGWVREWGYAL